MQQTQLFSLLALGVIVASVTLAKTAESRDDATSDGVATGNALPSSSSGTPEATGDQIYVCGRMINDSRGFIHTPSFPDRFPLPLLCRWILRAPPDKKIVLYFTQFYMTDSFRLTEYDYYENEDAYLGKHDLGTFSVLDKDISISVFRPFLVLKFQVRHAKRPCSTSFVKLQII